MRIKEITDKYWESRLRALDTLDYEGIPTFLEADGMLTEISTFSGEMLPNHMYAFASKNGKAMEYDIYFNKIQIHYHCTNNEKILEMFIAKESGIWAPVLGDASSSKVEKFRIYVWEKRLFMTDNFLDDERYISGSWNKYVFKQVKTLLHIFENTQESIDYDNIYNDKNINYEGENNKQIEA